MNGSSCSRNVCSWRGKFFCPKVRWQKPCEIPSGDPCDFLQDQDWKSWGSKTTVLETAGENWDRRKIKWSDSLNLSPIHTGTEALP